MVNGTMPSEARAAAAELGDPVRAEAEDVVGKPDVIRRESLLEMGHLGGDLAGTALQIAVAPDRLGAPVAPERAAARGRHVETEVAVSVLPDAAIAFDVDEVPGGQGGKAGSGQYARATRQVQLPFDANRQRGEPIGQSCRIL